jgi:hypothetical protein
MNTCILYLQECDGDCRTGKSFDSLLNAFQCGHTSQLHWTQYTFCSHAEKGTLGPQVINQQEVFRVLNFIFTRTRNKIDYG